MCAGPWVWIPMHIMEWKEGSGQDPGEYYQVPFICHQGHETAERAIFRYT